MSADAQHPGLATWSVDARNLNSSNLSFPSHRFATHNRTMGAKSVPARFPDTINSSCRRRVLASPSCDLEFIGRGQCAGNPARASRAYIPTPGPKREGATGARIDHSEQETQIRLKSVASLAPNNQVSHPY